MELHVECYDPQSVSSMWPAIERAMDRVPETWQRWTTKEHLFSELLNRSVQAWGVQEAENVRVFVITDLIENAAGERLLRVLWATSDGWMERGLEILDATLERFAMIKGCVAIEMTGRRGWEPMMRRLGARPIHTTFRKELKHKGVQ